MQSNWSENWSEFNGLIDKNDVVVRNVRLKSAAGWYVGTVEFYNFDEMDFYSRDSMYYPSEAMLKAEYPDSVSDKEAFQMVKHDRLLKRKMEKKLGN